MSLERRHIQANSRPKKQRKANRTRETPLSSWSKETNWIRKPLKQRNPAELRCTAVTRMDVMSGSASALRAFCEFCRTWRKPKNYLGIILVVWISCGIFWYCICLEAEKRRACVVHGVFFQETSRCWRHRGRLMPMAGLFYHSKTVARRLGGETHWRIVDWCRLHKNLAKKQCDMVLLAKW